MTPLRKTSLVAGIFYLITFISIPTLFLYGTSRPIGNFITSGAAAPACCGGPPRGHRCPGRHRHRRHAVPGNQAAERRHGARLRRRSHPRGRHDLHRCPEPALAGTPATGPRHSGRADTTSLVTTGASLVSTYNGTLLLGQTLMPCMSAVLLGTLMYRSGLVPRAPPDRTHRSPPADHLHHRGAVRRHRADLRLDGDRDPPGGPVGVLAGSVDDLQGLPAFPHHNWNGGSRHPADHPRRRPRLATST